MSNKYESKNTDDAYIWKNDQLIYLYHIYLSKNDIGHIPNNH